ncbi:MAG TPA: TIGR04211 family SH3 domain-containing protein [Gammaproteobacteria bacterium]|nr:TIGR04211 family SH3 domain-containing protein [Gammaproteobacteria bacterium]
MRTAVAIAILLGCATAAAAETAWVTDSLRLGLYAEPDASGAPSQNLTSGTALEVLERTQGYARVRTAAGSEGWVKSAYLVDEKPAALRVAELEAELASLRTDADRARAARVSAEDELHRLGKQVAATSGSSEAIQDILGRLKQENEAYEARLDSYRWSLPLPWVAAALLVALVAGFVGGLWWLDALIRRRHGGFRVY